jgi:hypothetical protein
MSTNGPAPGVWKLVKGPAIITLVVSLVRLIGELLELSPALFSAAPGGGGALVGITWLVLVFGFYFGWRLARTDGAPAVPGWSLLTIFVGLVGAMILFMVTVGPPEEGEPFDPNSFWLFSAGAWLCSLATLFTWPALFRTLLVYGLAARIPVVILTLLAVLFGWDTHHVGLAPGAPVMEGMALAFAASFPQIGFWVPFTVLVGGFSGGLGALFRRRRGS